jgi:hypothetical protein
VPTGVRATYVILAPRCLADLSGDGQVSGQDLGILMGQWAASGSVADLDGDGNVSGLDLGLLLGAWGVCP